MKYSNPLLSTDVYKMGHMEQYVPGINKVYSYMYARNNETFKQFIFFGLHYYLKAYLSIKLSSQHATEFLGYRKKILGNNSPEVVKKINALCKLGYFPILIKAIPEGTVITPGNVIITITNTHKDFYWVVGLIESLILKVWYSCTVATASLYYRMELEKYFNETVPQSLHHLKNVFVHDFGYRGSCSEESAAISGVAHLCCFNGTETLPALPFVEKYYGGSVKKLGISATPGTEHSVMQSYGEEGELEAFKHLLKIYPKGNLSIVSDTYNVYRVISEYANELKPILLKRKGTLIFRPDSGNPVLVILGNPEAPKGSVENKGVLRLLEEVFGATVNSLGYKELNPLVGIIYGDGIDLPTYSLILQGLKQQGWAASNLIIGVGKYLRNFTRDTLGFAIKATYVEINGVPKEISKKPVTDLSKQSLKGLLKLDYKNGVFITKEQCTPIQEQQGYLEPVFKNGKILKTPTIFSIRGLLKI